MKRKEQTPQPSLGRRTIALYIRAAARYPWRLGGAFVSSSVFTFTQDIMMPLFLSRLVDILAKPTPNFGAAYHTLELVVLVLGLNFCAGRVSFWLRNPLLSSTLRDLSMQVFRTFERQEYSFFTDNFVGSLVARASRYIRTFGDLLDSTLFIILPLVIQLVGSVVILAHRSLLLSLVFVGAAVLLTGATLALSRLKTGPLRRAAEAESRVTGALADALTNVLAIKVFARGRHEEQLFELVANERRELLYVQMVVSERTRVVRSTIIVAFHISIAFLLVRLTQQHHISVGTILLAQLYLTNLVSTLWSINRVVERLEEAVADSAEMTEVIVRQPLVQDAPDAQPLQVQDGAIGFNALTFRYKDATDDVLFDGLNLQIEPGQKVGLVGPSGGGKTTLTKLLLRFMDIDAGSITIDGQDVARVPQDGLRSAIAYVPQEPLLFHRSVRENIAYGNPQASEDEVQTAAKLAHAHEFITKLPQGYDTLVGERGVKLSGGEKQRVAIARAMLKKAPIVVLDEATSALDSKSEKAIVAALDNLMQNRTTIVIAHRLSTIRKLDRIVVLKGGQIAEDGPHATLLKHRGTYAELWQHQSGEFLPEE